MKVSIRLFAGLRERAGTGARAELPDGATVARRLGLARSRRRAPGLLYAVNKGYAATDTALGDGDEVALIPPVSGGDFRLSGDPLSLDAVVARFAAMRGRDRDVHRDGRSRSRDRDVPYLEYEAYEGMAEEMMAELAAELSARHELCAIAIHHRVGRVEIGEPRRHRRLLAAPRRRARRLQGGDRHAQGTVPLWKKEVYEGGEEWIGQGS